MYDNNFKTPSIHFWMWHKRYDFSVSDLEKPDHHDFDSWSEMEAHIQDHYHATRILPVYMYDHSDQILSTTPFKCPWDSGPVGFVWTSEDTISKEELVQFIEALNYNDCEDY